MVYTANWGIIWSLPPIKGTRKLHWFIAYSDCNDIMLAIRGLSSNCTVRKTADCESSHLDDENTNDSIVTNMDINVLHTYTWSCIYIYIYTSVIFHYKWGRFNIPFKQSPTNRRADHQIHGCHRMPPWYMWNHHMDPQKQSITLPETNVAPENRPLEKEIPIGNHHFQVLC